MNRKWYVLTLTILVMVVSRPDCQEQKVALVLSGGGALGITHNGVLKVIDELGIPIDLIVGTSMGSIVGGLYASGYTPDEIDHLFDAVEWSDAFAPDDADASRRALLETPDGGYLLDVGFDRNGVRSQPGLLSGGNVLKLLSSLIYRVSHIRDFDDLPIPFRAVAVDIDSEPAKIEVIASGRLAEAMRASMAVPGVFTPLELSGSRLVDGAVLRRLPVTEARDLGADIVIAVNIVTPPRGELTSPFSVIGSAAAAILLPDDEVQMQLADAVITVEVAGFNAGQFGRARELVDLGEEQARSQLAKLDPIIRRIQEERPLKSRSADRAGTYLGRPETRLIAKVVVTGGRDKDRELVRRRLGSLIGKEKKAVDVERALDRILDPAVVESVSFALAQEAGGRYFLEAHLFRAQRAENSVKLGFRSESEIAKHPYTTMVGKTNLTLRGPTWTGAVLATDIELGNRLTVAGTFLQDVARTGLFLKCNAWYKRDSHPVYQGQDPVEPFIFDDIGASAGLAFSPHAALVLSGGYRVSQKWAALKYVGTDAVQPEIEGQEEGTFHSWYIRNRIDYTDNPLFPTRGTDFVLDLEFPIDLWQNDDPLLRGEAQIVQYLRFGRNTVVRLDLAGGSVFPDARLGDMRFLGGTGVLPGYRAYQLFGTHTGYIHGELRQRIMKLSSMIGVDAYGLIGAGVGWVGSNLEFADGEEGYGGEIGFSVRTIFGFVRTTVGYGSPRRWVGYLLLST